DIVLKLSAQVLRGPRSGGAPFGDEQRRSTGGRVGRGAESGFVMGLPRTLTIFEAAVVHEFYADERLVDGGALRYGPDLVHILPPRRIVCEVVRDDEALLLCEPFLIWTQGNRLREGAAHRNVPVITKHRPTVMPCGRNERRNPSERERVSEEHSPPVQLAVLSLNRNQITLGKTVRVEHASRFIRVTTISGRVSSKKLVGTEEHNLAPLTRRPRDNRNVILTIDIGDLRTLEEATGRCVGIISWAQYFRILFDHGPEISTELHGASRA